MWVEVTARLDVSRPVLVMRLLELDAAGALTTAHARAGSPQVSHLYGAGWSRAAGTGLAWTGLRGATRKIASCADEFSRAPFGRSGQRSPVKRSFSGMAVPVVSWTRTKVSVPINSPKRSLPILRKKMFSP